MSKRKIQIEQMQRFIRTSLELIGLASEDRVDLMYCIGIIESRYKYIYEWGYGTARSFWQVEPGTAYDNFENYLNYKSELKNKILSICRLQENDVDSISKITVLLEINMRFALYMASIWIKRNKEPLPPANNKRKQGIYWDNHYNHPLKGLTAKDFVKAVKEFEA